MAAKPSTPWGVLVTRESVAPATERPDSASVPPSVPVSGTSVTVGSTADSGTVADISAVGAAGWPGRSPTMSSETTPEAGVSTARTTPSASSCWQRVMRRA